MKRLMVFGWILMMCLLPLSAFGEDWGLAEDLTGTWTISSEGEPGCLIQYVLPQFVAADPADEAISRFFANLAETGPTEELLVMAEGADTLRLSYQLTHMDDRYLGLALLVDDGFGGGGMLPMVFARDGIYAGERIGLSQLLGLESDEGNMQLNRMVTGLIWEIVQKDQQNLDRSYLERLSLEMVEASLDPEWDFLLDDGGNLVFLIAPGEIAAEVDGWLEFPFSPEELINGMK